MNGQPAVCSPNGTILPDPGLDYVDSKFNLVRDALVGQRRSFNNAADPWCIIQDDALRGAQQLLGRDEGFAYYRPMCCALASGDSCTAWAPCGEDHARGLAFSDAVQAALGNYQLPNGALTRYGRDVKFSLMTADSRLETSNDARGLYSYGDEVLRAPDGSLMNLGIRRDGIGNGALIKGNRGHRFLGLIDWNILIGEDSDGVQRHNELVGWQVRRAVPVGDAPLSAMLHDAVKYVQAQAGADADFECRRKVAVLVTQGREMVVYGGEPCPCAADAQCVNGQCVFPAGFPYDTAETYAARLRDEGVPVYVISVGAAGTPGDLRARAIAQLGSPHEGPGGGPGYFRADSLEGLSKAFDRVIRSALRGQRSHTKPLAIASTVADYCDANQIPCARPADAVVQWRINTYSEVDGGGMYGRVQATEMTCAVDGEDNGRPGAPKPSLTPVLYEEVLANQASPRRTISTDPLNDDALFVVTGAAMPMFNGWGGLGGLYNVAQVDAMTGIGADPLQNGADGVAALPDHDPTGQLAMGLKLNGYFGDRGLPDERGEARRQLGAMLDGDTVALRVPDLGLALPSYQAYEVTQRARLSLVAAGARDGMVHVFRANDGREIFNIVPRAAWGRMAEAETPMDGPLDVADVVPCRTIGEGGPADCPSEPENWQFQAWLVGGVGVGGDNYFGVNMTRATGLARDADRPMDPAQDFGAGAVWDTVSSDIINENIPPPPMGLAVSRPVLTHVRVRDQIKAAVIAGCGDDTFEGTAGLAMSDGAGRCVLILEATTGALIRKFSFLDNFNMSYPFTGSPVAYPADGVAPADRAYIGDRQGRLWRMDLRDADPANWTIDVAFPLIVQGQVDVDAAGGYELGREVVDRPSLSLKADGGLVVIFGTGERSVAG
ncbi:MAG: hypothetical protein KC549_00535, partial [Myxococcales bacterium]|nr:hypothetical protein [Myxococcales bacterium]